MEGFGLVSKRGRRIYKEGLFPSEWSGSATAISLPKDFSHNTKNLAMIFGGDILSMLIEWTTSPPLLPRLLFKGLWLSPHRGHFACTPRRCLPTPTSEQDCALSFHGRVHHPRLFLSLREVQYTAFWDTRLPRQSLTPLSRHSLVALPPPRRLCYSVRRHPTPRPPHPPG